MNSQNKNEVDRLKDVVASLLDGVMNRLSSHSDDEILRAYRTVRSLTRGGKCNYDLPAVGPMYSLLYHAKRFQDALYFIEQSPSEVLPTAPISVLDYGAGTGAAMWAMQYSQAKSRVRIEHIGCFEPSSQMRMEGVALWRDMETICRRTPSSAAWHSLSATNIYGPSLPWPVMIAGYFVASKYQWGGKQEIESCLRIAKQWGCRSAILWVPASKVSADKISAAAAEGGWQEHEPLDVRFECWFPRSEFPDSPAYQRLVGLCHDRGTTEPAPKRDLDDILTFSDDRTACPTALSELLLELEQDNETHEIHWNCVPPDRCACVYLTRR